MVCKKKKNKYVKIWVCGYIKNKNKSGYSYTLNKEKAKWFANRFGNNGLVETRTINKSDVFAYTNQRGENEIIILK